MPATFKSEMHTYKDSVSGLEVTRLTSSFDKDVINLHMYFTDNSFTTGDKEIIFSSNRNTKKRDDMQLFSLNLETGVITQLSDIVFGHHWFTKTPDSSDIVLVSGSKIFRLCMNTGKTELIYEQDSLFDLGMPSISCDKRMVGFASNENVGFTTGANYSGFAENMYAIKKSRLSFAYMNGSKCGHAYEDTHWMGHFQFSPTEPTLSSYCHEGPWNLVQQRIWLFDFVTRSPYPCVRQAADDSIGHEFWTRDGLIFFDNRGKGHDGTITKDLTQAVAHEETAAVPVIGFADTSGKVISSLDLPYYCNHYHATTDNKLLVGDAVKDLMLIDISGEKPAMQLLAHHGTSWNGQYTHPHPTVSWGSDKVLFASDREGGNNLYLVNLPR